MSYITPLASILLKLFLQDRDEELVLNNELVIFIFYVYMYLMCTLYAIM